MSKIIDLSLRWTLPPGESRTGHFRVHHGRLLNPAGEEVTLSAEDAVVSIRLEGSDVRRGKNATVVEWVSPDGEGFAFMPAMLPAGELAYVPDLGVVIGADRDKVSAARTQQSSASDTLRLDPEFRGREITWEAWAARSQKLCAPTVLGLPRDHRLFLFDSEQCHIAAMRDLRTDTVLYDLNRATTADLGTERSLEDGHLPIVRMRQRNGALLIEDVFFASFADAPLREENIDGTPWRIAHLYSAFGTFPEGGREAAIAEAESYRPAGEVVLFLRTTITNLSQHPALAPVALPRAIQVNREGKRDFRHREGGEKPESGHRLDADGLVWSSGAARSRHAVDGRPPEALQICDLLPPGGSLVIDSLFAHSEEGLSAAAQTRAFSWEEKFAEAKAFWSERLARQTRIQVPEKRWEDFWKAGTAHLDLVTLGEKTGPLVAKVGIYTCIGSESIPIVEFYDSLGRHEEARRCIDTFFELQQASGRINAYLYYDIETGAVLHLAGQHYACTRNREWVRARSASLKAAADYLLSLRQLSDETRADYGLVSGTCADPKEPTTAFMLNSYNAAGLRAVADMLGAIEDPDFEPYAAAADEYLLRLRQVFAASFTKGPILPVGPHRWVPTCSFRAEGQGPQVLGLDGEGSFTHRMFFGYDALLGPPYAVYLGVVSPSDRHTDWLLEVAHRHYLRGLIAESQPFYSRHPELHLIRGERELFLNAFYSGIAATSDHETFSFWEHLHKVSPHKTHEEAWALMQLRRMLWLEAGDELRLLPGIPESWLDPGQTITVEDGHCAFGKFSFRAARAKDGRTLELRWDPEFHSPPGRLRVFLPGLRVRPGEKSGTLTQTEDGVAISLPSASLATTVPLEQGA